MELFAGGTGFATTLERTSGEKHVGNPVIIHPFQVTGKRSIDAHCGYVGALGDELPQIFPALGFVAAGFPTNPLEAVSVQRKETQPGCAPRLAKTNIDAQIGFGHVPPMSPVKRSPPDFSVAFYLRRSLTKSNVLIEAMRTGRYRLRYEYRRPRHHGRPSGPGKCATKLKPWGTFPAKAEDNYTGNTAVEIRSTHHS